MIGKHPRPCHACRAPTYTASGFCRNCAPSQTSGRPPISLPVPKWLPEDYLTECAHELLRRHQHRAELMAKLGILVTPSTEKAA